MFTLFLFEMGYGQQDALAQKGASSLNIKTP
jgi:hypothetical protein